MEKTHEEKMAEYRAALDNFEEKLAEVAFSQLTPDQLEKVAVNVDAVLHALERDPEAARKIYGAIHGAMPQWGWKGILKRVGVGASLGAGGLLAMKGINHAFDKVHDYQLSMGKAKAYKEMVDSNPQLSGEGADARAIQQHFDTLYKFNPEYAKDPQVAGAYVQNAVEMARPNLDTINNIVNARKNLADASEKERGRGVDVKGINAATRDVYEAARALYGIPGMG